MKLSKLKRRMSGAGGRTPSVLLLLFQIILAGPALGQVSVQVPLTMRDIIGHRHTIVFGIDSKATYGFDADLNEMPIPPVPGVPAFDIRFLDPDGRKQYPFEGAYTDLRPYVSPSQRDTFHVGFQPAAQKYPMYAKWSLSDLRSFDDATLILNEGGVERRVNMKEVGMIEIASGRSLVIVTSGVRGVPK
jgi:hypothetical protein